MTSNILTKLVNTYATSFYGSGLWNLDSSECEKVYTSWNVTIRQIFKINRCTHRNLIESVSQCLHLKVMLASRFVTFFRSLINCSKVNVRFLARLCQADQRTVLGRNLSSLLDQCGTPEVKADDLTSMMIKRKCCYSRLSDTEQWKASMLKELIEIRDGQLKLENLDAEEVAIIIEHLCTK